MPKDIQKGTSFNLNIKKLIYFLMACDEKQVKKALLRYGKDINNNDMLIFFLRRLEKFFKSIKRNVLTNFDDGIFYWKQFCQKHHYEEVLVIALAEIMKCSTSFICWIVKIRPEILSYRLNEGLLSLGEVILEKEAACATEKIQAGKKYCQSLSLKPIPLSIQNFSVVRDNRKWFIRSVAVLAIGLTTALLTLLFFLLKPHSPVILYQDSF